MKQTLLSHGFCIHGTRAVKYYASGTIIIDSNGRVTYTYSHGSPLVTSSVLARSPADIPVILSMFRSRTLSSKKKRIGITLDSLFPRSALPLI